jgi:hypothetical protein
VGHWTNEQVSGGPCAGSVHIIPVPRWMTAEEVWETLGRGEALTEDPECTWAAIECPGGDACECRTHPVADTYQHHHDDVLVYDHASTLAIDP